MITPISISAAHSRHSNVIDSRGVICFSDVSCIRSKLCLLSSKSNAAFLRQHCRIICALRGKASLFFETMAGKHNFSRIGFIGLGAMGKPMMSHLAKKLPADSKIWVYDVVEQVVDEACTEFPHRVFKGESARHVAGHAVGSFKGIFLTNGKLTWAAAGHYFDHGTRGLTRAIGLS